MQRTLKGDISCSGIGLHSGKNVNMRLLSAEEDSGITFIRTDMPGWPAIKAISKNVVDTRLATTIGINGATVSTVEHLLAAFYGLGIDNAVVEVDSCEVPIMDGSAAPFVKLIQSAGIKIQDKSKRFIVIKRPVKVREGRKLALFLPAKKFKVTYSISFEHPSLTKQVFSTAYSEAVFKDEICSARTFGFLKDVELLRSQGLARGGSLDNAIVIGEKKILNNGKLRYHNELVRHKILDCLGDLALLGVNVIGHIIAMRSGHSLNQKLVKKVIENPSTWIYSEEIPASANARNFFPEVEITGDACCAAG